jgi:hypothetical protein
MLMNFALRLSVASRTTPVKPILLRMASRDWRWPRRFYVCLDRYGSEYPGAEV